MVVDLGVLHDTDFVIGKEVASFIRYMDDEVKTKANSDTPLFGGYMDYMDNPLKSSGLFDSRCRYLTVQERRDVVNHFQTAHTQQSIMWRDLFSFRNEWLEEIGLLHEKTGEIDELRLMHAVKAAMDTLVRAEKLQNYKWVGAMHHNTEHLHFHVAGVELTPSREWKWHQVYQKDDKGRYLYDEQHRKIPTGEKVYQPTGVRQKSSLIEMKRTFVHQLVQSAEQLKVIDRLAREEIAKALRSEKALTHANLAERTLLRDLYLKLPKDKRLWNMKNARKHFFGHEVRAYIHAKLDDSLQVPFQDWKGRVKHLGDLYERTYNKVEIEGAGAYDPEQTKYFQNSLEDLYQRAGNAVLSQLREVDKERAQEGINRKAFVERYMTDKDEAPVEIPLWTEKEEIEDIDWFQLGLHSDADLSQKGPSDNPYTQEDVDRVLSGLIYTPIKESGDTKPMAIADLSQKDHSNSFKVVNVYWENKKIRVMAASELERKVVQQKFEKEVLRGNYNLATPKSYTSQAKFIAERQRAYRIRQTLRGIDRQLRHASDRWQREFDYDRFEQQLIQESLRKQ
ncbi:MobP2 family relaxase [Listeria goaensis]|uniref:MobP2 family relaxase n=1 Tax=Listeria goaensis TaxID=1649188 RepID=UPI000B58B6CD|nr:MobP2 family relaxase [Listeria goaensis]